MCEVIATVHTSFPESKLEELADVLEKAGALAVYDEEQPAQGVADVIIHKPTVSRMGSFVAANLRIAGGDWPQTGWVESENGVLVPLTRMGSGEIPGSVKLEIGRPEVTRHFEAMSRYFGQLIFSSGIFTDMPEAQEFDGAVLYPWVTPYPVTGWVPRAFDGTFV